VKATNTKSADVGEIARALDLLMQPDDVHELRALDTPKATQSGYFTGRQRMVSCATTLSGPGQVYVSLNPTIPDLLAQAVLQDHDERQRDRDTSLVPRRL